MEFQLPKAYEEILERSFEIEAILLQNDRALEILLKLNEFGTLMPDLLNDDETLIFLLNYGYILKKEGSYYLSKKSNEFFKILGIKPNQSIKDSFILSKISSEIIINFYDLRDIPDSVLIQNLKFTTIDSNIFIKISEPRTTIECKLMINCISNLNLFLSNINNYLSEEGKITLYYQTNEQRKKYLTQNKNYIQRQIIRFFDFFARVFYKGLRINSNNYSMAEILGRLVFNGFEIIENVNNIDYSVVNAILRRKVAYNEGPKRGPLIKITRIGKYGKEIYIYKFRTLYPYSEYLTDFIYQTHKLYKDGTLHNDFRISPVGKILRKFWLDELPMYINLFKGDIKIFGVRPLSAHYLNLYPSNLRARRSKCRPGLLTPYLVDLPKSLDGIFKSEEHYLSKYEKNPIRTDLEYILKSMYYILIKTTRWK